MRSTLWPVSCAMRPSTVSRMWRRSSACTSTSTAEPPIPAEPWCMRIRACGRARRLPFAPADSRNCPALHASPRASVATSLGMRFMTSRIASIEGTDPPGEWIHSAMSDASSSAASARSCVASSVPLSSSRGPSSTSTRWWNSSRRASAPNRGILPSSAMPPSLRRADRRGIRFRSRPLCPQRSARSTPFTCAVRTRKPGNGVHTAQVNPGEGATGDGSGRREGRRDGAVEDAAQASRCISVRAEGSAATAAKPCRSNMATVPVENPAGSSPPRLEVSTG